MHGQQSDRYQDWVAEEWAGEDPAGDPDLTPRWTKDEWVGDRGRSTRTARRSAAQMPEGARGLSGFRHIGPASHWAPSH